MLKRTLFFTTPCKLSVESENLKVLVYETGETRSVAIEDVGFVILENAQISFTLGVVELFAKHNIAAVFCSKQHLPASMLFNLDTHSLQNERFRHQFNASIPLKKQLWKQLISSKISNQSSILKSLGLPYGALTTLSKTVKSGDSDNREAVAAKKYWHILFGKDFVRAREGKWPNAFLNYAYTILRAATARALCGSGLLPTLGIFHKNRYNDFPLADDIMEPYRPFVDAMVWEYCTEKDTSSRELTKEHKQASLNLLICDTFIHKEKTPLMNALSHTTSSLASCFGQSQQHLTLPTWVKKEREKE